MAVRPVKTQISLGIRPVWSESSLSAWRKLRSLATHWAHSEDSDQTGRMPRLIWVFAGHTVTSLILSCCGSITVIAHKQNAKYSKLICISFIQSVHTTNFTASFISFKWFEQFVKLSLTQSVDIFIWVLHFQSKESTCIKWATSWENLFYHMQTTEAQFSLRIWSVPLLFAA